LVRQWFRRRWIMVLPHATGATTHIIHMRARPMAITDQVGLAVASSSVRVPGMDGAGGMDLATADTAFAVGMDSVVDTDTAAATDIVVDTPVEAELLRVVSPVVDTAADTLVAVM
jgi:hypothetical protein